MLCIQTIIVVSEVSICVFISEVHKLTTAETSDSVEVGKETSKGKPGTSKVNKGKSPNKAAQKHVCIQ